MRIRGRRAPWPAAAVLLVAGCAASGSPAAPSSATPSSPAPTSSASTSETSAAVSVDAPCVGAPEPRRYDHVIWVVMENKDVSAVRGPSAPETSRFADRCAWAADHHAVTHPSLPNYLALTSGSTHGVTDDRSPASHPIGGDSVFGQAARAGIGWATYAESMPSPCAQQGSGRYAVKHNPAAYYTALRSSCAANDVALGTPESGAFADGLRTAQLPGFVLVVPDLCSDTHDCSVAQGDAWLGRWIRSIVSSPVYAEGRTALMVTWDEDDDTAVNRVGLLLIAPSVQPGTVIRTRTTHGSVLRTTEELLGLPTTLAPDATSLGQLARLQP